MSLPVIDCCAFRFSALSLNLVDPLLAEPVICPAWVARAAARPVLVPARTKLSKSSGFKSCDR